MLEDDCSNRDYDQDDCGCREHRESDDPIMGVVGRTPRSAKSHLNKRPESKAGMLNIVVPLDL